MRFLLAATLVLSSPSVFAQEIYKINANKFCADAVGIPYASDDFTDKEWKLFKQCLNVLRQYKVK